MPAEKPIVWMGDSKEVLRGFPEEVQDVMGFALGLAQHGDKHPDASPMKGHLREVVEIRDTEDGNAFRVMYTVKLGSTVYVLHAFQKKATQGIKTPQRFLDTIERRLQAAKRLYVASLGESRK